MVKEGMLTVCDPLGRNSAMIGDRCRAENYRVPARMAVAVLAPQKPVVPAAAKILTGQTATEPGNHFDVQPDWVASMPAAPD
jgi:hypothetical protein